MKDIKRAILVLLVFTILLGIVYPLAVTGAAMILFPKQAAGSLIYKDNGTAAGSWLIGQSFTDPKYFWPRPSATADFEYNPLASGGSNLGPTNLVMIENVRKRVKVLRDSGIKGSVPVDLVTTSSSGLDPHLTPQAAFAQVPRVAKSRNIPEEELKSLVMSQVEKRQFGFLGAERVNVLKLNFAMDEVEK
ncbi:MAG: potassium-transporting ATPase subunit KdpC [Chloroflexi bacterium]|nr:potassium-transporting ATPase subunit KdpC [Chloroflexota bacterium]